MVLTDEQRATSRGWLGAGKTERRMAFRAEVILAIAEGLSNILLCYFEFRGLVS